MHREELATVRAGRSGREVVTAHQLDVIRAALPGPCRLLEVGCGRGEVAVALAAAGHRVTAIDPALPDDVMSARNVRFERVAIEDLVDDDPYDAIAFTASLHHVEHLGPALDRAAALLAPNGVLVIDDFDLHAPDEAAALWFFELQEILAVAGLYDPARIDGKATQPPVARWLAAHTGHAARACDGEAGASGHCGHAHHVRGARDPRVVSGVIDHGHQLQTKAAMLGAVHQRFSVVVVTGGPYLYRYIAGGLRGPRASWVAEAIRDAEKRRIGMGVIPAVGLQITARRK